MIRACFAATWPENKLYVRTFYRKHVWAKILGRRSEDLCIFDILLN